LARRKKDDEEEQVKGQEGQQDKANKTEWMSRVRVDEDVGAKESALAGYEANAPQKPKGSTVFPSCVEV